MSNFGINGKNDKSTDMMVNYLQDDEKMIPNRKSYRGNHGDDDTNASSSLLSKKSSRSNKSNRSNSSYSSDASNLDEYVSNDDKKDNDYSDNNDSNKEKEKEKNLYEDDDDDYNKLPENKKLLKRLDMIRKLGELALIGCKISKEYNINDDYFMMKYEYMLHHGIRAKQNFKNWSTSIYLNCIYGIEILNENYDPFSLKLTGWSEQVNSNIDDVNEIFGEIYEKYNKPGQSMSPELKLVLMFIGGGVKFHLTNKMGGNNSSNAAANNVKKQQEQFERQKQMVEERMKKDNEFAQAEMNRMKEYQQQMEILKENARRKEEENAIKRQAQMEELRRAQEQLEYEEQNKYNGYNRNEDISRQLNQITDKIKSNKSFNTEKSSNSRRKPNINVNIESSKNSDNYSTTTSNSEVESSVASKDSGKKSTYSRSKYNKSRLNFNI